MLCSCNAIALKKKKKRVWIIFSARKPYWLHENLRKKKLASNHMFNDNVNSYIWIWSLLFSVDMSDEIWLMDLWRSPTWYGSRGDWRKMRWRHKKVYPPWRMGSNQHALRSTRTCLRVLSRALPWYHLHLRVAKTSYVLLCQYDCTLFLNIRFVRFFSFFFFCD